MKKSLSRLIFFLSAFIVSGLAVSSCVEEMPEVIEDLNLPNVLTPGSTSAVVSTSDGRTVTFTWTNSNTATQYLLEVYRFATEDAPASADEITEEMLSDPYMTETVTPSESGTSTSVSLELDAEYSYYARVCGQNTENEEQGDSKWAAFPYPIDTYTVMDPVESFTVTDRTSESVSVSWTLAEGDEEGVNQLRISPHPTDASAAYLVQTVAAGETSATVTNLQPSVRYTIAAHYNSANRGTVYAWTRPDMNGVTRVSDTSAFRIAIKDGAPRIAVVYADTAYYMGQMNVTASTLSIYGEETVDGAKPRVIGTFSLADGVTDFRAEALHFDGNSYEQNHLITFASAVTTPINTISIVNCDLTSYKRGLLYASTGTTVASIGTISFDGIQVSDTEGNGGEAFGFRGTTGETFGTIGTISVRNSTFTDGMREFFRIDDSYSLGTFTFENNTLNNLTTYSNSYGLFYIRAAVGASSFRNNVILNMSGSSVHGVDGRYVWGAAAFNPATVSNNWWYNLGDEATFFTTSFTSTRASSGGGALLSADPCYNSERGLFNITNAAVLSASAGDPRWLSEYVEQPDPDLVPVEYGYNWDLTDTDTYYDVIDQSCVRGNTRFVISSNPINVTEEGFEFTAEPTFEYAGTPTDCAMAFLVDGPGSVVISTAADGSTNDHISVAYGPADGSSVTEVSGAVHAGAARSRVVFADFNPGEQHLIWIYACGPIVMSELSWISDTSSAGASPLDTPANVAISLPEASEGSVTLSWDAVDNAASYMIRWTGPVPSQEDSLSVTGNSHDFAVAGLATGMYSFSVRADVSETDVAHEASEFSEAVGFIRRETLTNVSSSMPTTWGLADFTFMQELIGSSENTNPETIWGDSFVYNNLEYYAGNTIRFANSDGLVCFQYPGSSNNPPDRRFLRFLAGGSGTVTVTFDATATGRNLYVSAAGTSGPAHEAPTDARGTFSEAVTANAGDEIILWADASLRVFEITWTPAGYDPDATIPSDPLAVEEQKDVIDYLRTTYGTSGTTALVAAGADPVTIDKITYAGKSDKSVDWDGGSERIKLQGASEVGDDGIPTSNYISFKVTKPGTIKHYLRSGSGSDTGRTVKIDLVMNDGADIVNLYEEAAPTGGYSSNEVSTQITSEQLAQTRQTATVYIYAPVNSVNVYYLEYIPD